MPRVLFETSTTCTKEIQYDLEFHATFETLKSLLRLLTLIIWPHYVEAPEPRVQTRLCGTAALKAGSSYLRIDVSLHPGRSSLNSYYQQGCNNQSFISGQN